MAEVQLTVITYGSRETLESTELCFPVPSSIVYDVPSLYQKFSNSSKSTESKLKRYFVLFLESIDKDADDLYEKLEENPQVVAIFNVWNESFIPTTTQTKLYYIPKDTISLVLSFSIIQFLKSEAEKQVKLNQFALSKIYLRKAEKTKEWIMTTVRVCLNKFVFLKIKNI
jgi:hypothetical protein